MTAFDEEDQELVEKFQTLKLGKPQLASLPEGWDILSELAKLPDEANYFVETLQGGTTIGMGWKRLPENFTHALLARARACDLAENLGNPTRVLIATRKELLPVVIFYKKNKKLYVSMRVDEQLTIEQEITGEFDTSGVEGTLKVTFEGTKILSIEEEKKK